MDLSRTRFRCLFLLALLAPACDAQTDDDGVPGMPASSDPRCAALCIDEPPEIEGAYDVCSAESSNLCVDLCEQRIEEADNICAECLLEDAVFRTPYLEDDDVCGDDGTCYVGLDRFCSGGCWTYGDGGGECWDEDGDGNECDGAEAEYREQIDAGLACSYPRGDDGARAACHAMLHPRQDVTCDVEFDSVTACADVCG